MIGVDIVDLNDPHLKQRKTRALNLILSDNEALLDHPEVFWIYWTAKESVFKASRERLAFNPRSIHIDIDLKKLTFQSKHRGLVFHGKCQITKGCILSYCHVPQLETKLKVLPNTQVKHWPSRIREIVLNDLNYENELYTIGQDENDLPVIEPLNLPISFSHHHQLGAYIYPIWVR